MRRYINFHKNKAKIGKKCNFAIMEEIIRLRHLLHSIAEPSGSEIETNKAICDWLRATSPDLLIEKVGGYGIIAIYKGKRPGKRIMLRADIDALYIPEDGNLEYKSCHAGVSHRCGHDGHAAMLCGVAAELGRKRSEKGEVMLVFQPAEETGQGAPAIIADKAFQDLKPDMAFGLHNIPGFEHGTLCLRKGCFAAASFGMKITLEGATAHASQPEKGLSPSIALAQLTMSLEQKRKEWANHQPLTTFVITHSELGEKSFGIAPGHAEIWLTLRSYDDKCLDKLKNEILDTASSVAQSHNLTTKHSIHEAFTATVSDEKCFELVEEAGKAAAMPTHYLDQPFRWSEDFGRYAEVCPIAFFGLGSGTDQPPLHDQHYDFPDTIIPYGIKIFKAIIERL